LIGKADVNDGLVMSNAPIGLRLHHILALSRHGPTLRQGRLRTPITYGRGADAEDEEDFFIFRAVKAKLIRISG